MGELGYKLLVQLADTESRDIGHRGEAVLDEGRARSARKTVPKRAIVRMELHGEPFCIAAALTGMAAELTDAADSFFAFFLF